MATIAPIVRPLLLLPISSPSLGVSAPEAEVRKDSVVGVNVASSTGACVGKPVGLSLGAPDSEGSMLGAGLVVGAGLFDGWLLGLDEMTAVGEEETEGIPDGRDDTGLPTQN